MSTRQFETLDQIRNAIHAEADWSAMDSLADSKSHSNGGRHYNARGDVSFMRSRHGWINFLSVHSFDS